MTAKVTLCACIGTLLLATTALAHHPGGGGNSSGGGPIFTIPASTLEQGHYAVAFAYEYARLGGVNDSDLINAAAKHIHAHSIKTIESAVASFAYGITNDLTVAVRAPVNRRTDIREGHHSHGPAGNTVDYRGDSTGFGDVTVLGQWRFLNNVISGTQAALLLGIKAPTGTTNLYDQQGVLFETEFQPGTGSWDALAGAAFSQRFGEWSFDTNVLYIHAGGGAQSTNMGNRFLYNAAVSYRLFGASDNPRAALAHAGHDHGPLPRKAPPRLQNPVATWTVDAILEVNGEWHDKEKTNGVADDNSGGNTVYVSPGIRLSYERYSSFVLVGIPVVNNLNGIQSEPRFRVVSGMSFSF
jgi:hypothetical protein